MRLNGDFLGWTEPCSWYVQSRMPHKAEPGKKGRKNWLVPAMGQWAYATSFNLFIWGRSLNILTGFTFSFLSFLQGAHKWLPARRRAVSPFSLCYRKSMKTLLMHCTKACTPFICLGTTDFFQQGLQYVRVSAAQSQCRGQCSGCLCVKVQVKEIILCSSSSLGTFCIQTYLSWIVYLGFLLFLLHPVSF